MWEDVFQMNPPSIKNELKEKDKVITLLKESFVENWPNLKWTNYQLDEKDQEIIKRIKKDRFNEFNHPCVSSNSLENIDFAIL